VQWCISDPQITGRTRQRYLRCPIKIGLDDVLAQGGPPGVRARHLVERSDGVDSSGDLGVGRRHDLRAITEIDLVPVVLRWVV
jgi:hypothetical protein